MKIKYLLILWLAFFSACAAQKEDEPVVVSPSGTYINPSLRQSAPDPTVIRARDGMFYAYATEDVHNVPIFQSSDLMKWTQVGTAFTNSTRPTFLANGAVWAPDIRYINGKYVLYYSLSLWGEINNNGIGVATALTPVGPFTDQGSLVISKNVGVLNSIDQCYFEEDGHKYLIWGSFQGIYYIELADNGLKVKTGSNPIQMAGKAFEATYLYKHNNYYYLFASTGSCCEGLNSTYKTVVGRSNSFVGPYLDKNGNSMLNNACEVVIHGSNAFKGTGHNSGIITDDNGDDWIMYHAFDVAEVNAGRCLMLDKIIWVNDWPTVTEGIPSSSKVKGPVFKN
jgi:arabinan endo-1,5-alpha-L-arabinosidase